MTKLTVICLLLSFCYIWAMPPREELRLPTSDYEELARLGINVSKNPVRDIGKRGIHNTPGDVIPLVSGTKNFPVVCIKFPDYVNIYSTENFQAMLFSDTWSTGSAQKYYKEVSYGIFNLTGETYGWYTADYNKSYYGYANGIQRAAMLAKEAAQKSDAVVNYALYDNDGDGYVDCFTCIHSWYGREETGSGTDIHSHSWNFISAGIGIYITNDPDPINGGYIKINEYVICPERSNYSVFGTMVSIGVFCHEWGHALGLPDLYDTSPTSPRGRGLGTWCLMSAGSWGADYNSPWFPAHLNAWAKMELGWLNPTAVRTKKLFFIPQVETNSKAYWLIARRRTFKEYFLVENRRKTGFDTLMYGQGLLIYHIDDSIITQRRGSNQVNAKSGGWKYGVALEQADGLDQLYEDINNGDANDPWPGGLNRTLFDSISTIPNTKTNYPTPSGLITGCYVKDISNSSPVMSCTLSSGIIGTFIGGPDAFGYTYLDSDTIDGPIYNWIDITQTGIILGSGDDVRYSLSLPFQFYFYGRTYNRVWVCTNGWLSFGPDPGNSSPNNTSLPNTSLPNRTIYVFWDDLNLIPSNGGKIYYQILGNAPNRYCVITWQDAQIKQVLPGFLRPINPITFQVILYENGQILLQYKDCAVGDTLYNWGRSATIGIEDSTGTVGLQYLYNGTPLGNLLAGERAIQFTRPVYKDIAVIQIDYPTGTIESTATTIVPQVKVRNNGYNIETFDVTLRISNLYLDVRSKTLLPGTEDTVQFQEWIPIRGTFTARCSVHLENDIERSNDTLQVNFTVNVRDFSAKTISAPLSPVQYGDTVIPKVWIHNYGSIDETTVPVTFYIPGTGYNSTLYIDLAHRDSVELSFDPLVVDFDQGSYSMRCTTKLNNDAVPSNNLATALLTTLVPGWVEMCTIPTMPPGKGIKDGGALAIVQNKIYALQGGNTSYLYQYDIESNDWITKPPIPYLEEEGRIYKRNVKAGGSLVAMGRTLYAFKGGNTSEFWAYLTENDSWIRRASIPEQESLSLKTTKVKTGGALVAHRCSIYAFKGGNTNEFWLYNPNTDSWYQRKSLITSDGKKIKGGACLVALNDTIYAFVGGNTYHFYAYTPDTWVKKADAKFGYNYSSTKKKIKDGAALVATADGKIYAFKGGNTKDLGCYDIALDTWFYVDTIPGIRRVKYGGALASYEYSLYAMKGGNNSEFWRYTPPITKSNLKSQMANMPILTDNTKLKTQNTNFILTVSPNPFSKFTTIRYNIPVAGKVTIKLYDATGKLVKTLVEKYHDVGTYSIKLNADNLTKGLYFLRFFSIINYMTVKLTLP